MDSLLPELETFNLIHPTCASTTSHQLKQREILANQPLVLFEILDDDNDEEDDEEILSISITTTTNANTSNINSSKNEEPNNFKPSEKCLQHRYSSEFIFNPISKKSITPSPLQKESTPTSSSSFSPISCEKKRKRDQDDEQNINLNLNNSNNNNSNNNNSNNNCNDSFNSINSNSINLFFQSNPTKYLKSLKQPKVIYPKFLNKKNHIFSISQTVHDNIFSCVISTPLEGW